VKPLSKGGALVVGGVFGALIAVAGLSVYAYAQRDVPRQYSDIQEEFKYGSIGAEARSGLPYWVWLVLPTVFPQYLPAKPGDGYARFGFIYETPGATQPIGNAPPGPRRLSPPPGKARRPAKPAAAQPQTPASHPEPADEERVLRARRQRAHRVPV